jgi:hypothetical protein
MATIDTDKTWPDGAGERFAAAPVAERGRGGTCRRFRRLGHGETAPMTAQNQPENDRDLPSADLRSVVQPLSQKYFCFSESTNQSIPHPVPPLPRGAYRDRHGRWVRDVVDAWVLQDELHRGVRRSRVVLTPRRWRQVGGIISAGDGGKQARSPGRARSKP